MVKIDVEDWHNRLSGLLHHRETALLSICTINHVEFSLQPDKTNSVKEFNAETLKPSRLKSQLRLWSFLLSAHAGCF